MESYNSHILEVMNCGMIALAKLPKRMTRLVLPALHKACALSNGQTGISKARVGIRGNVFVL